MAEDKASFERECETRRSDLARIQNKRVQEFDLLTTTAGLDLIHIVQATEPKSPVKATPPDLSLPAGGISNSPAKSSLRPEPRKLPRPFSAFADISPARCQPEKPASKDQRSSPSRIVPQYVPMVSPKPKPSQGQPTPEATQL